MEYAKKDEGKCITCGFAAKRARVPIYPEINRAYFEIPLDERQRDKALVLYNGYVNAATHTCDIACFRGKEDLASLVMERSRSISPPASLSAGGRAELHAEVAKDVLLDPERACADWYGYEPGRTPQERLADHMWEQLEKRRQDFEERLSARAETVQLRVAERDEQLQIQRDREQGRNTRLITRITIVGILIAFAQVLTLTKDSVLWKLVAGIYHWVSGD